MIKSTCQHVHLPSFFRCRLALKNRVCKLLLKNLLRVISGPLILSLSV